MVFVISQMTERVSSELAKPDDSIAGENKENQTTKVYVTKVPIDVTEERLGEFFKNHA